jgi:(p)ppGpp synthase/HD superfamily hydrolase
MSEKEFNTYVDSHREDIEEIRNRAHMLHDSVNQHYDKTHPYGFHLDMVADSVFKYGHLVCQSPADVLPVFFAAFYHDSIEDARLTYNDVTKAARLFMGDEQAYIAAEMVYALTNEKGRTRAERANERYYQGIRETPYAPFLKLADRLANITYSCTHGNKSNKHMHQIYQDELPHFLEAINPHSSDPRRALPQEMIDRIYEVLKE